MRKKKADDPAISQSLVDIAVESWRFKKIYASGKTWFGLNNLFGPETSYVKFDTQNTFQETKTSEGTRYSVLTITLYTVYDGNATTTNIGAKEF